MTPRHSWTTKVSYRFCHSIQSTSITFVFGLVYFYNFKWKDFDSVNEKNLLDMVKVVIFALSEGKVIDSFN